MSVFLGSWLHWLLILETTAAQNPNKCAHLSMATLNHLLENSSLDVSNRWLQLPKDCAIRNSTSENARMCLSNIKIAFFGDSISRDFGHAMLDIVNNRDFGVMSDRKYEKKLSSGGSEEYICICRHFPEPLWGLQSFKQCHLKVDCAHGTRLIPNNKDESWEITVYTEGSYGSKESFPNLIHVNKLMNYDLIVLGNTGLHGINKNIPAYPFVFFQPLIQLNNTLRGKPPLKSGVITLPFIYLLPNKHHDDLKKPLDSKRRQSYLVDYVNALFRDFTEANNVPYFETGIVSNHKQASDDGVHIKQWANLLEVKMLLHFICDDKWGFKRVIYY
jgi:hypothetical protein